MAVGKGMRKLRVHNNLISWLAEIALKYGALRVTVVGSLVTVVMSVAIAETVYYFYTTPENLMVRLLPLYIPLLIAPLLATRVCLNEAP